jgi:hypothetical protein
MCDVGVHFYVRQPVGLRVLSYVRQHGGHVSPTWHHNGIANDP